MGMIAEYVRLRPAEITELRRLLVEDPDDAYGYAGELRLSDSARGLDIDKTWDGLRHLLGKLDPPVDVVAGGEPLTAEDWGYSARRLLAATDVVAASRFLDATPFAVLARLYDPAELMAAEVYPLIWDEPEALSYLEDHYGPLVAFFRAAAAEGEPILAWLT
jgi:hypothetical protein